MPSSSSPTTTGLSPETLRTHTLSVRVNAAEYAALTARRDAVGMREMGAYLRTAVLAQRPPQAVVPVVNRQAWQDLARTASNLNQLTAHLNAGNLRDPTGTARLRETLLTLTAEVRALRLALLGVVPDAAASTEGEKPGDEA